MTETIYILDGNGAAIPKPGNKRAASGKRYAGGHPKLRAAGAPRGAYLELPDVRTAEETAAIEDAVSPETLALAIKIEAGRRIEAVYPVYKQRNMAAEATDYNDMRIGGGTLDAAQELRATALRDAWTWIKAVRAASNTLEADVAAMDLAARQAFDVTDAAHWPANPARPA